jgi:hypothetical protein
VHRKVIDGFLGTDLIAQLPFFLPSCLLLFTRASFARSTKTRQLSKTEVIGLEYKL